LTRPPGNAVTGRKIVASPELAVMRIRSLFLAIALVSSIALMVGSTVTSARYVRPVAAQDGRYGAVRGSELIGFKVKNRVVEDLFFNVLMECHDTDTGENYLRAFTMTDIGGGRVPFNGSWRKEWDGEDALREGHGLVEVEFKRNGHVIGSVSVIVPGGGGSFETCHGFFANRVRRGPLS
jgi:hypothetical protein